MTDGDKYMWHDHAQQLLRVAIAVVADLYIIGETLYISKRMAEKIIYRPFFLF